MTELTIREKSGKIPEVKKVTLVLESELYDKLVALAKSEHRSMQGQLVNVVERAVREWQDTMSPPI